MKILLLNKYGFDAVGGVETTIKAMAQELSKLGHLVFIFSYGNTTDFIAEQSSIGVIYRFPYCKKRGISMNTYKTNLSFAIEKAHPDVIVARDVELARSIQLLGYNDNLVYIPPVYMKNYIRLNSSYSVSSVLKNLISYGIQSYSSARQRRVLKDAKNIQVFSENMKQQIVSDNKNVSIVLNRPGVRFDLVYENLPTTVMEKICDTRTEQKYILYLGRLAPQKNIHTLIDACKLLDMNDFTLLILGNGSERKRLQDMCPDEINGRKIIFLGEDTDVSKYYGGAIYSVVPSEYEAFGNVIVESMYCGTPVIALRGDKKKTRTAADELICDGKTGFLVEENTPKAFASVIVRALAFYQDGEYAEMRRNCHQFAEKNFSWEKFCVNMLAQYSAKE